mgnify:CR=1 FL=1
MDQSFTPDQFSKLGAVSVSYVAAVEWGVTQVFLKSEKEWKVKELNISICCQRTKIQDYFEIS